MKLGISLVALIGLTMAFAFVRLWRIGLAGMVGLQISGTQTAKDLHDDHLQVENRSYVCQEARNRMMTNSSASEANKTGIDFLFDQGVLFAVPPLKIGFKFTPLEQVKLPIFQCGDCTDYDECRVSFRARLVGENIIQSVEVSAFASNSSADATGDSFNGDYTMSFTAPPMPGTYNISLHVRWWRGMDDVGETPVIQKALDPRDGIGIKKKPYLEGLKETTPFGAPLRIQVDEQPNRKVTHTANTEPVPICEAKDLNSPGYWERVDREKLCANNNTQNIGECWILDEDNRNWLWRTYSCRFKVYSPKEVSQCLEDRTMVVLGDSLPTEVCHNLLQYVPHEAGRRVYMKAFEPFFRSRASMEPPTDKLYIITDFNIAHRISHNSLLEIQDDIIPRMISAWPQLLRKTSATQVLGIYYPGYIPYNERMPFCTDDRMRKANELYSNATTQEGFYTFDSTRPQISRMDASWDGLHLLRVVHKVGGVSKMLTMMLLNKICDDSNSTEEKEH